MPVIRMTPCNLSPRQMLYSRCPGCECRLCWRGDPNNEEKWMASCCEFWFSAIRSEDQPLEFVIDGDLIDYKNVIVLKD